MPQHVYIIGAKGLGNYGGYETFVDKLTEYHENNPHIRYHIACKANGTGAMDEEKLHGVKTLDSEDFIYHNAYCHKVEIPAHIGPAQTVIYDCKAFEWAISDIKKNNIEHPIVYILACRIGLFINKYVKELHALGGRCYINPDGHEWMRSKWSKPIKAYWKYSEGRMVRYADLIICDSKAIEKYIREEYIKYKPKTTFIAYGAEVVQETVKDEPLTDIYKKWADKNKVNPDQYYLMVGRFVPENNYETVLRELLASETNKDLIIITTPNEKFAKALDDKLHWSRDSRIKFVGTVYDEALLKEIRLHAFAYIHGHSVGGTNPSLLEALGATEINLLYDCDFNREVAEASALYWTKETGNLTAIINKVDTMLPEAGKKLGQLAKDRIRTSYSWGKICDAYEDVFRS